MWARNSLSRAEVGFGIGFYVSQLDGHRFVEHRRHLWIATSSASADDQTRRGRVTTNGYSNA